MPRQRGRRPARMEMRRNERGATVILVALLTVPLFGFGALVVDVGALYQERRELQNGVDAAALALARDCAGGACGAVTGTAGTYVDANADDGASALDEVCGVGAGLVPCLAAPQVPAGVAGWVRVTSSTDNATTGTNEVTYGLARVLTDKTGATVRASAVAAWGWPGGRRTVPPLTVSECELNAATDPDGDGVRSFVNTLLPLPQLPTTLILHGSTPGRCPAGPSGGDLPGGFGWLDSVACSAVVGPSDWVTVDPGNNGLPNGCGMSDWRNRTLLIPVYDQATGTGTNGRYHISGFAAFHVTGYKVGNQTWPAGTICAGQPGGSGRCLIGHFTTLVTSTDGFGGKDYGVVAVKITG